MSIEAARAKLGEIVDRARLAGQPTQITRQGKPAAVVVSAGWYAEALGAISSRAPVALTAHPGGTGQSRKPEPESASDIMAAMRRRRGTGQ